MQWLKNALDVIPTGIIQTGHSKYILSIMNLMAQSTVYYYFNNNESDLHNIQIDEINNAYGDPPIWVAQSMMHYFLK